MSGFFQANPRHFMEFPIMSHLKSRAILSCLLLMIFPAAVSDGQDSSKLSSQAVDTSQFRPVPTTRPMMKQLIEDMKQRTPRIPLPSLTPEDEAALGERASSYESRLRYHYLGQDPRVSFNSTSRTPGTPSRVQDPESTLSYAFKVQLFWIVSRSNNCQYCIGHQESKLLAAGIEEDTIAAMDCDWTKFTDAERAAFAFARKYTLEPHELQRDDVEGLKKFYSDSQILEMCLSMSWNNAINRWKEGIGVPQSADEGGYSRIVRDYLRDSKPIPDEVAKLPVGTYLTPTASKFGDLLSIVAPIGESSGIGSTTAPKCIRPELESHDELEKIFSKLTTRTPTLELLDAQTTRERLNLDEKIEMDNWMRLLCRFPVEGAGRAKRLLEVEQYDQLSPLLRAQIAWVIARQDRAWYALAHARQQLLNEGATEKDVVALDGDWSAFPEEEQAIFTLARNLAASPVVLTDRQVEQAVTTAGPRKVVQAVDYVTQLAAFNRITEAAQLPLESPRIDRASVRTIE